MQTDKEMIQKIVNQTSLPYRIATAEVKAYKPSKPNKITFTPDFSSRELLPLSESIGMALIKPHEDNLPTRISVVNSRDAERMESRKSLKIVELKYVNYLKTCRQNGEEPDNNRVALYKATIQYMKQLHTPEDTDDFHENSDLGICLIRSATLHIYEHSRLEPSDRQHTPMWRPYYKESTRKYIELFEREREFNKPLFNQLNKPKPSRTIEGKEEVDTSPTIVEYIKHYKGLPNKLYVAGAKSKNSPESLIEDELFNVYPHFATHLLVMMVRCKNVAVSQFKSKITEADLDEALAVLMTTMKVSKGDKRNPKRFFKSFILHGVYERKNLFLDILYKVLLKNGKTKRVRADIEETGKLFLEISGIFLEQRVVREQWNHDQSEVIPAHRRKSDFITSSIYRIPKTAKDIKTLRSNSSETPIVPVPMNAHIACMIVPPTLNKHETELRNSRFKAVKKAIEDVNDRSKFTGHHIVQPIIDAKMASDAEQRTSIEAKYYKNAVKFIESNGVRHIMDMEQTNITEYKSPLSVEPDQLMTELDKRFDKELRKYANQPHFEKDLLKMMLLGGNIRDDGEDVLDGFGYSIPNIYDVADDELALRETLIDSAGVDKWVTAYLQGEGFDKAYEIHKKKAEKQTFVVKKQTYKDWHNHTPELHMRKFNEAAMKMQVDASMPSLYGLTTEEAMLLGSYEHQQPMSVVDRAIVDKLLRFDVHDAIMIHQIILPISSILIRSKNIHRLDDIDGVRAKRAETTFNPKAVGEYMLHHKLFDRVTITALINNFMCSTFPTKRARKAWVKVANYRDLPDYGITLRSTVDLKLNKRDRLEMMEAEAGTTIMFTDNVAKLPIITRKKLGKGKSLKAWWIKQFVSHYTYNPLSSVYEEGDRTLSTLTIKRISKETRVGSKVVSSTLRNKTKTHVFVEISKKEYDSFRAYNKKKANTDTDSEAYVFSTHLAPETKTVAKYIEHPVFKLPGDGEYIDEDVLVERVKYHRYIGFRLEGENRLKNKSFYRKYNNEGEIYESGIMHDVKGREQTKTRYVEVVTGQWTQMKMTYCSIQDKVEDISSCLSKEEHKAHCITSRGTLKEVTKKLHVYLHIKSILHLKVNTDIDTAKYIKNKLENSWSVNRLSTSLNHINHMYSKKDIHHKEDDNKNYTNHKFRNEIAVDNLIFSKGYIQWMIASMKAASIARAKQTKEYNVSHVLDAFNWMDVGRLVTSSFVSIPDGLSLSNYVKEMVDEGNVSKKYQTCIIESTEQKDARYNYVNEQEQLEERMMLTNMINNRATENYERGLTDRKPKLLKMPTPTPTVDPSIASVLVGAR